MTLFAEGSMAHGFAVVFEIVGERFDRPFLTGGLLMARQKAKSLQYVFDPVLPQPINLFLHEIVKSLAERFLVPDIPMWRTFGCRFRADSFYLDLRRPCFSIVP